MNYEAASEPGRKAALAISIAVHSLLVLALFFGLQWRTEHAPLEVELWSVIPTPAIQVPPPPPPQPKPEPKPEPAPEVKLPPPEEVKPIPKPDIAIKPEDPKKEPPRKEPPKKEPPKEVPKEPAPPKPDFSRELERELQKTRENTLLAKAEREAQAAGQRLAKDAWEGRIAAKIKPNIVRLPNIPCNLKAEVHFDILPSGEINPQRAPRIIKSSGNSALDEVFLRAIWRSSPLPLPDNPAVFERRLELILQHCEDG